MANLHFMTIIKNLVSLIHYEHLKLFKFYSLFLEQVKDSTDRAHHDIAPSFSDSLQVVLYLISSYHIAHLVFLGYHTFELLYHLKYLDD